jgi:galactokinase
MKSAEQMKERFQKIFGSDPAVISAAPGRVEFIGNHTDYNLGPVIGVAIDRRIYVAIRRTEERVFRFASEERSDFVSLKSADSPVDGEDSWVNYPLGVYNSLIRRGLSSGGGFEIYVDSDLPTGAGLASSAALELASGKAMCQCFGLEIELEDLAVACKEAENEFVGVPCGILDQGVSAFGKAGSLVHIDCRDMVFSVIPLGKEVSIWIFNTHKKHALVESLYSERHEECLAAVNGLVESGLDITCLADVTWEALEKASPSLDGKIAKRAEHIVGEISRVEAVKRLLEEGELEEAGKLLFQSHASSRDLFENSIPELDYLVEILRSMPGVLGARLTGGGFGGAVMALAKQEFTKIYAESVASAYRGRFGEEPETLECHAADGACILESV